MSRRAPGQLRIRSNVVLRTEALDEESLHKSRKEAWEKVPGDLLKIYRSDMTEGPRNRQKREEAMWLTACSTCGRRPHEFRVEGCERPDCSSAPDSDRVERYREAWHKSLELADKERSTRQADPESVDAAFPPLEHDHLEVALARLRKLSGASERLVGPDEQKDFPVPNGSNAETGLVRAQPLTLPDSLLDSLSVGQARKLQSAAGGEPIPVDLIFLGNIFGPWIGREGWLRVGTRMGFTSLKFELATDEVAETSMAKVVLSGAIELCITCGHSPGSLLLQDQSSGESTELLVTELLSGWGAPGSPSWLEEHVIALRESILDPPGSTSD